VSDALRVSVVIPVYNEGEAIVPCLERILRAVRMPA
jgi:dolichol-phosphate mannosyltransferase